MIDRIKTWLRRGRDEADLEAILAHNAQVKREQAELDAQARKALARVLAEGGDEADEEPPR